jgi:hypothetical protein
MSRSVVPLLDVMSIQCQCFSTLSCLFVAVPSVFDQQVKIPPRRGVSVLAVAIVPFFVCLAINILFDSSAVTSVVCELIPRVMSALISGLSSVSVCCPVSWKNHACGKSGRISLSFCDRVRVEIDVDYACNFGWALVWDVRVHLFSLFARSCSCGR